MSAQNQAGPSNGEGASALGGPSALGLEILSLLADEDEDSPANNVLVRGVGGCVVGGGERALVCCVWVCGYN